jgi:nitrate reductase delta subunit
VIDTTAARRALSLFADILEYPSSGLHDSVQECCTLVSDLSPDSAAELRRFQTFIEGMSPGRIEEFYSQIFDLNAVCHPYVGYHLFGESYKRSAFLVELKERFRASDFTYSNTELPDRLSIMLRYLATKGDAGSNGEIIAEGMIPALRMMTNEVDVTEADPEEKRTKLWDMFSEPQFKDEIPTECLSACPAGAAGVVGAIGGFRTCSSSGWKLDRRQCRCLIRCSLGCFRTPRWFSPWRSECTGISPIGSPTPHFRLSSWRIAACSGDRCPGTTA